MPATLLARLFTFTPGTVIASSEVSAELNQLIARINLVGRNLVTNTTPVGNVGASGPDNLMSYQVAAGLLAANGDRLVIEMEVAYNANDVTKAMTWLYGGVTISATSDASGSNGNINQAINIRTVIVRTGATTANFHTTYMSQDTAQTSLSTGDKFFHRSTLGAAITHANANTVLLRTDTSTADNDIVQNMLTVDYWGA